MSPSEQLDEGLRTHHPALVERAIAEGADLSDGIVSQSKKFNGVFSASPQSLIRYKKKIPLLTFLLYQNHQFPLGDRVAIAELLLKNGAPWGKNNEGFCQYIALPSNQYFLLSGDAINYMTQWASPAKYDWGCEDLEFRRQVLQLVWDLKGSLDNILPADYLSGIIKNGPCHLFVLTRLFDVFPEQARAEWFNSIPAEYHPVKSILRIYDQYWAGEPFWNQEFLDTIPRLIELGCDMDEGLIQSMEPMKVRGIEDCKKSVIANLASQSWNKKCIESKASRMRL